MSIYRHYNEQAEREAFGLRARAGGGLVLKGKAQMGRSMNRGHGWNAASEESWVVAATIEALLAMGVDPEGMFVEFTIEPGSRPDLLVVADHAVSIFEAKRGKPINANRTQVRRYLEAASRRWPGRPVHGWLVWPENRWPWPYAESDLRLEVVLP